jgi:gamma-glutamyl-gamma-aminobutyrate hydrolase PuuD
MIVSLAACAALAYNWLPGKEITVQDAVSTSKDIVQTAQNYLEENVKSLTSKEKGSLVPAVKIEANSEQGTIEAIPPNNAVSRHL